MFAIFLYFNFNYILYSFLKSLNSTHRVKKIINAKIRIIIYKFCFYSIHIIKSPMFYCLFYKFVETDFWKITPLIKQNFMKKYIYLSILIVLFLSCKGSKVVNEQDIDFNCEEMVVAIVRSSSLDWKRFPNASTRIDRVERMIVFSLKFSLIWTSLMNQTSNKL